MATGHRFASVLGREHDWGFTFDGQVNLVVECLWRLIEKNRIRLTNLDDRQQFGLPAPVDAAKTINVRLNNAAIKTVTLREGTFDLQLKFDTGHILEIIPNSSGFEAWNIRNSEQQFVAVGGGELAIFQLDPRNRDEPSDDSEPE